MGAGTTFDAPSSTTPPAGDAAAPASAAERRRILVIDDEPRVGELLLKILSASYETLLEAGASTALDLVRAGAHYDVILCDLMMPDMAGMDLQEVLDRDFPELAKRTIFVTGGAFTARAQEFVGRFEGRLLQKPFRIAAVEAVVREVLGSQVTG